MKRILLLGSTGSIGENLLDIVEKNPEKFRIAFLSCRSSDSKLAEQAIRFRVDRVHIVEHSRVEQLKAALPAGTKIFSGDDVFEEIIDSTPCDLVVNAIVGAAGLEASYYALKAGKTLALANKESMVAGGELLRKTSAQTGAEIIPIDSEHSAIWQCMLAGGRDEVEKVILTASGGPFRSRDRETFSNITVEEALNHPNWNMGQKITIDSATLMNKGLEVIEACYLFDLKPEQVDIVIHSESIIHSMVQFIDGAQIAQLSPPDMRLPIAYALGYPCRLKTDLPRTNFPKLGRLTFEEPDRGKFPSISLAYKALSQGGIAPLTLNAANEIAVESFLAGTIIFSDIPCVVNEMLKRTKPISELSLENLLHTDRQVRIKTRELINSGTLVSLKG